MRTKKNFSFDEEKDAERIVLNGFSNGIDYGAMYLVAKYFRHRLSYGAIRLEREIIRFCETQDKNFNPVTESDAIKKWVKSAMNYGLRKIDSLTVSQKEIDFLKTIESQKDRKLLFMCLILSKALKKRNTKNKKSDFKTSEHYYIHYNNFTDIIRLSGLKNITEVELAKIFHKYKNHLSFYSAERELIRIDYADKNMDTGLLIDKLDRLLEFYELLFEENKTSSKRKKVNLCVRCGKLIIKKNNYQKYCAQCSKEVIKEKQRALMKKKRLLVSKQE